MNAIKPSCTLLLSWLDAKETALVRAEGRGTGGRSQCDAIPEGVMARLIQSVRFPQPK
jgi:hypothetical protein